MKKTSLLLLLLFSAIIGKTQNVGIGTPNPTEKLDVNGNVNIAGTIKANGVAGTNGQVLTTNGTTLSWGSIGSTAGYKHCQMFYTSGSGTWTVPDGVSEVMVEAWGAGSGGSFFCGGTSGTYARTTQNVSSGSNISYTIGVGSGFTQTNDGGNTSVILPAGSLTAIGGKGVPNNTTTPFIIVHLGSNKIDLNPSSDIAAYYMAGNRGEASYSTYGQKAFGAGFKYTETIHHGSGGAPIGLLNAAADQGPITFLESGQIVEQVMNDLSIAPLPSAGGAAGAKGTPGISEDIAGHNGAPGMVIFWWN